MAKLDAFTRAYIETALWSTTDNADESGGEPLDANYGIGDIAPETLELMVEDCADFQEQNDELIADDTADWALAGHDFWLTREGHGAGFWDGGWPKHGDELTEAAKSYGPFELYIGDDGLIYGPPPDWYREHHPIGGHHAKEALRYRPPPHVPGRYVMDFRTLPELVQHERDQNGATHVLVTDRGIWVFYPPERGKRKYRIGQPWQEHGYWHAPAPEDRTTGPLSPEAVPVEQYLGGSQGPAKGAQQQRVHWKGDFSNPPQSGTIDSIGSDGYATITWDDGRKARVPAAIFSTPRWRVERGDLSETRRRGPTTGLVAYNVFSKDPETGEGEWLLFGTAHIRPGAHEYEVEQALAQVGVYAPRGGDRLVWGREAVEAVIYAQGDHPIVRLVASSARRPRRVHELSERTRTTTTYHVIPVTTHAGGRRESGRAEIVEIDHADVAMMPHEILSQHGIHHYRFDYTDPSGRWIEVAANDHPDAVRALRSYSPTAGLSEARTTVQDYVAVDPSGRTVAGPFKTYGDAKAAADQARGYVKFATDRPPREATEARSELPPPKPAPHVLPPAPSGPPLLPPAHRQKG